MTILWVGDAVASTGFSLCTHKVCDYLYSQGHDINVLGLNYWGDPHPYPYTIYPCFQPLDNGGDRFGVGRLPFFIERLNPDVVILLNDQWNIPDYIGSIRHYFNLTDSDPLPCPIIAWLAVDSHNQKIDSLSSLAHIAVWTRFAANEFKRSGYLSPISVIPLGVDTSIFHPYDQASCRAQALPPSIPSSAFIIGVVGRNQTRKRLDLTLSYFAHFIKSKGIDNAYLYLHTSPTGESACDLQSLSSYYDIGGRVIVASPDLGLGVPESAMPLVYSSFDLYLSTSQGEGWGLPCLEAMACGVPCIVPDNSAFGVDGWTQDAAYRVPCTSTALSAPLNGSPYTIGEIMDKEGCVEALWDLYIHREKRHELRVRGLRLAESLTWERTGEKFQEMLISVLGEVEEEKEEEIEEEIEEVLTVLT